ncbi:MAG TPA: hypothetical protein VNH18_20390 [Bryobacteraceae bacterium]|nr:hypothetical protein [Bryobacteraceae bacterium]
MLVSEQSIASLVDGFESGTWPVKDFHHAEHVAIAAWYATGYDDALDQLRVRIPEYNVRQGGQNTRDSGYHETLTCFWFHVVSDFLADLPPGTPRIDAIRAAAAEFGSTPGLFRAYYDFDVVKSQTARAEWMEPSEATKTVRRWRARGQSTVPV